jgi:hypothetical protein
MCLYLPISLSIHYLSLSSLYIYHLSVIPTNPSIYLSSIVYLFRSLSGPCWRLMSGAPGVSFKFTTYSVWDEMLHFYYLSFWYWSYLSIHPFLSIYPSIYLPFNLYIHFCLHLSSSLCHVGLCPFVYIYGPINHLYLFIIPEITTINIWRRLFQIYFYGYTKDTLTNSQIKCTHKKKWTLTCLVFNQRAPHNFTWRGNIGTGLRYNLDQDCFVSAEKSPLTRCIAPVQKLSPSQHQFPTL